MPDRHARPAGPARFQIPSARMPSLPELPRAQGRDDSEVPTPVSWPISEQIHRLLGGATTASVGDISEGWALATIRLDPQDPAPVTCYDRHDLRHLGTGIVANGSATVATGLNTFHRVVLVR
ncbi:hypothetical protein PG997_006199 [Apiospora hydei]|uniref:Uncharacterized protein n=1 Tax=Apiospora hydei TaxID=1337664 RepID=A0ABR1WN33_9PEZI